MRINQCTINIWLNCNRIHFIKTFFIFLIFLFVHSTQYMHTWLFYILFRYKFTSESNRHTDTIQMTRNKTKNDISFVHHTNFNCLHCKTISNIAHWNKSLQHCVSVQFLIRPFKLRSHKIQGKNQIPHSQFLHICIYRAVSIRHESESIHTQKKLTSVGNIL